MTIYEILDEILDEKQYKKLHTLFFTQKRDCLDTDDDKKAFDLLTNVSSLIAHISFDGVTFGSYYRYNGTDTYSIDAISDDDYRVLESLDIKKIPLILRTLISDILWTVKKKYDYAKVATESYWALAEKNFSDTNCIDSLNWIKRVLCIAIQTSDKGKCTEIYDWLINHIIELNGDDEHFLSLKLIEIFLTQKKNKIIDKTRKSSDINQTNSILDRIIANSFDNYHKTKKAYELKIECFDKIEDKQKVNVALAEYNIKFAEEIIGTDSINALRAVHYFEEAVLLFKNNGAPEKSEEAHRRLIEIQKNIPKNMITYSASIDVTELNQNINLNFKELSFEESIIRIAQYAPFFEKENIKKTVLEDLKEKPLLHMWKERYLNENGQTVVELSPLDMDDPEGDIELLKKHMYNKASKLQEQYGNMFLRYIFSLINNKYPVKPESFEFLTHNNFIIPDGRERIIRSALSMAINGQIYESLHILAPQTESIFRYIAEEVGGLTVKFEDDGTSQEKTLGTVLCLPELLECYDNDILFTFNGLLNEKAGTNIRNEIAHGILNEDKANIGVYFYFIGAFIHLLTYSSKKCYEIKETSERLKKLIKPDTDSVKIVKLD